MRGEIPAGVTSIMTRVVARALLPVTLIIAAAVLVKGYVQPGDGFSAGVIAALGFLMQYLAFGREVGERILSLRAALTLGFAGLLLALAVAATPLFLGDPLLTHYPRPGEKVVHIGTLELITAVAFDVGIFLLVLGYATGVMGLVARTARFDEEGGA